MACGVDFNLRAFLGVAAVLLSKLALNGQEQILELDRNHVKVMQLEEVNTSAGERFLSHISQSPEEGQVCVRQGSRVKDIFREKEPQYPTLSLPHSGHQKSDLNLLLLQGPIRRFSFKSFICIQVQPIERHSS